MVIRIPFGGGIGAVEHHSESPETYFVHTPGLKVVACGNPVDAYWMIQQAIASDDPVIFFEPKRRYHEKADVDEAATPPVPQLPVVRPEATSHGHYGATVGTCLAAAEAAAEDGLGLEVMTCVRCPRWTWVRSSLGHRTGRWGGARGARSPSDGRGGSRAGHDSASTPSRRRCCG